VVGWGWGVERTITFGSDYLDALQWLGTNDLSAYLSVPAAIRFQREHNWHNVRERCHEILCQAVDRICALTGEDSVYPDIACFQQMAIAPLPNVKTLKALKTQLYDDYRIEVPLIEWDGRHFVRISVQGYNSLSDVDALSGALESLLPLYTC
jgi:isopenicillin-N epimerase